VRGDVPTASFPTAIMSLPLVSGLERTSVWIYVIFTFTAPSNEWPQLTV